MYCMPYIRNNALVYPIGRRIEGKAGDDLVIIGKDREQRPIATNSPTRTVDPFDRVGKPRMQTECGILMRPDRGM